MPAVKSKPSETSPDLEDDKYYDVLVSESFEYKRVKFGVISKTHVSGEFLKDVMSSEHKDKVVTHTERA